MDREIKFKFVFRNPNSKEVIVSKAYSLDKFLGGLDLEDVRENTLRCDCEPIGETNVIDCNCDHYYETFVLIDKLEYAGLKDKNGVEIYEGDIVRWTYQWGDPEYGLESDEMIGAVEYEGGFLLKDGPYLAYCLDVHGHCLQVIGNIHTKEV